MAAIILWAQGGHIKASNAFAVPIESVLNRPGLVRDTESLRARACPFYDIDEAADLRRLAEELRLTPGKVPKTAMAF
jgi:hypothetical protein